MATTDAERPPTDRVAVITGGGRGLGRAMARGLTQSGCRVVVTAALESGEIEAVVSGIGSDRMLAVIADVTRGEDCARVVAAALSRFGRLDILVNNAGRGMKYVSERFLMEPTRFWDVAPDVHRMIIDTNVNGPFLMARAAVPSMLRSGWGRIVNVSVSRDTMHRAGFTPYRPSKAALESATNIWAKDLAGTGVTVNALLPGGATETGMIPDGTSEKIRASLLKPDVMIAPMLWLASTRSDGVTGKRVIASRWRAETPGDGHAIEDAGCPG